MLVKRLKSVMDETTQTTETWGMIDMSEIGDGSDIKKT